MGIPAAEFGDKLCCVHYKQRVGYSELLWFKMEPSEDFLPQTSECLGFLDVVFPNVLPFFLEDKHFAVENPIDPWLDLCETTILPGKS